MKTKFYIGVTGVSSVEEVNAVKDIYNRMKSEKIFPNDKDLMLGYLVSNKTLNNNPPDNLRYPEFKDLPKMLKAAGKDIFTVIHYNSRDLKTLPDQIISIFDKEDIYKNNLCRAFQLNIAWPDPKAIEEIKLKYPEILFILSLTEESILGKSAYNIATQVNIYSNLADYILIDPSGGGGKPFNIERSANIYKVLKDSLSSTIKIGFAGGFTPENVRERTEDLKQKIGTSAFSIDIEAGGRNPISQKYGDDLFSKEKIEKYQTEASDAFRK